MASEAERETADDVRSEVNYLETKNDSGLGPRTMTIAFSSTVCDGWLA